MLIIKALLWVKALFSSSSADGAKPSGSGWIRYAGMMLLSGALSGLIVYVIMDARHDALTEKLMLANGNLDLAKHRADNAKTDIDMCRTAVAAQNTAINALETRAAEAEAAMATANQARQTAEQRASDILRERTPAGADKCESARKAFSEELRKERGQ